MTSVLTTRTLTRATAVRQWLAQRQAADPYAALDHLVGLQAQEPLEPYAALWARLVDFRAADLAELIEQRRAARTLMMRRTLHLLTAPDVLALRPVHQTMLVQKIKGLLAKELADVDWAELAALGEPHFAQQPRLLAEVAGLLADRWPDARRAALGDALSCLVPLVQVPPRGVWGSSPPRAHNTTIEVWLDGWDPDPPQETRERVLGELVLRYLRAYGPASSSDLRSWSGLTGLPAVVARLRPQLRTFRDESGRELLDVEDGELPDEDLPLPARFLPAFDNAVLGYADRSRIIDDEHKPLSVAGAKYVLLDGRVAGTWVQSQSQSQPQGQAQSQSDAGAVTVTVTVTVTPLRRWTRAERDDVAVEGEALATFLGNGAPGRLELAST